MIYRFSHSLHYANSRRFSEELTTLINTAQPPLRWLCIDVASVTDMDYSAT